MNPEQYDKTHLLPKLYASTSIVLYLNLPSDVEFLLFRLIELQVLRGQ